MPTLDFKPEGPDYRWKSSSPSAQFTSLPICLLSPLIREYVYTLVDRANENASIGVYTRLSYRLEKRCISHPSSLENSSPEGCHHFAISHVQNIHYSENSIYKHIFYRSHYRIDKSKQINKNRKIINFQVKD